jgi:hypothetical protein
MLWLARRGRPGLSIGLPGALLPVCEVLGQAGAKLLGAGRLAVDLDQAYVARDPA